jgi:hypothetical protein
LGAWDAIWRETWWLQAIASPGAGADMTLAVKSMIHGTNQTLAKVMTLAAVGGLRRGIRRDQSVCGLCTDAEIPPTALSG